MACAHQTKSLFDGTGARGAPLHIGSLDFFATSAMLIVVAGLIERGGRFLITQRPPQKHGALKWEFPGGKLEEGEDPRDCLIREIKEELNLEIAVHRIAEVIFHRYPDRSVLLLFYFCSWIAGEPQAIDCADFAWVERAHLTSYDFLEADLDFIKHLAEQA